jgi:hypothetical protein
MAGMQAGGRPRGEAFRFSSLAVGTAAGALDGALKQYVTPHAWWARGAGRIGMVGLGVLGYFIGLPDDVSYGLQTAGTFGLAGQVAPAIGQKSARVVLADVAPARVRPRAAPCATCAQDAMAAAPDVNYAPGRLTPAGVL